MVQDGLGVLLAKPLGLHPFLGLVAGSITLVGGHGTGAAYVEKFGEASAIPGVMALRLCARAISDREPRDIHHTPESEGDPP